MTDYLTRSSKRTEDPARLDELDRARKRAGDEPCPITERDLTGNRLAAARVWLHAETQQSHDLWGCFAAKAILRGLDGEHVNPEAMGWLAKQCVRGDYVHRQWAQEVYRTLEERK